MNYRVAIIISVFALLAGVALSNAQTITPYSNSTQVGFHVANISTDSVIQVIIGTTYYNITQNYITPNETGETVNGHSYDLYLNAPVQLSGQNSSYIVLAQVNYIPRLHTVNFNIYQLQPPPSTTTTSVPSTTTVPATSLPSTTAVYNTTATSIAPTTTTAQPSSGLSGILQQIISLLRGLLSRI